MATRRTNMKRMSFVFLIVWLAGSVGCASKNYVKEQTTPLINKVNELDDLTAQNTKEIKAVDQRAQAGIQQADATATAADQKAQAASQTATQAQTQANAATQRCQYTQLPRRERGIGAVCNQPIQPHQGCESATGPTRR